MHIVMVLLYHSIPNKYGNVGCFSSWLWLHQGPSIVLSLRIQESSYQFHRLLRISTICVCAGAIVN